MAAHSGGAHGGDRTSAAERTARRARVFVAITQGQTSAAIMRTEDISPDTLTADLKAINERMASWAADQQNRALGYAIAAYQRVIDQAFEAWTDARAKLDDWLAGEYDREEYLPDADGGSRTVRKPPILRLQMAEHHRTIIEATKELAKLAGLDKQDLTIHGDMITRVYQGVNTDEV